jgi:hypothetical protein
VQVQQNLSLQHAAGDASTENAMFTAQCLKIMGVSPPDGGMLAVDEQRTLIVRVGVSMGWSWLDTLVPLLLWTHQSVDPGYHGELWKGSLEAIGMRKQRLSSHPVNTELAAFDLTCETLCKNLAEGHGMSGTQLLAGKSLAPPPAPDMQDDASPFPQLQVLAFCLGDNAGLHNPWLAVHLGMFVHLWCPDVMDRPLPKLVSLCSFCVFLLKKSRFCWSLTRPVVFQLSSTVNKDRIRWHATPRVFSGPVRSGSGLRPRDPVAVDYRLRLHVY